MRNYEGRMKNCEGPYEEVFEPVPPIYQHRITPNLSHKPSWKNRSRPAPFHYSGDNAFLRVGGSQKAYESLPRSNDNLGGIRCDMLQDACRNAHRPSVV